MPITPLHTVLWSQDQSCYELYTRQQLEQAFDPEDFGAWLVWLDNVTTFAFRGACGNLNVYLEARKRGGSYWYAYHTNGKRTHKRYLGRTDQVTFAHLEEAAHALHQSSSSPSQGFQPHQGPGLASDGVVSTPPFETTQGIELLATRLAPPLLPSLLVSRDRLLSRLDEARSHRLTLLSASAGWGKTTLLSTWASRCTFPLAWLSLDELDNDSTRFWASVLAALRTCLPGVGQRALLMLRSPQPLPLSVVLITLLNELSGLDTSTFLLLDDYHLIGEQAIHDSMLFLLDHLPTHLHLILSSRIDPELSLSRWRARGQLLELRDADLRFEEKEAARFLTHTMGLPLETEEVTQLARRTEGWIAGLQLAALSLVHHPDRAAFVHGFTGSHRYVLDYVQEEILARLTPEMQGFVLSTSILHRLSASLCQAVTAQAASQEMLETIERANLFLVPLDDRRHWYRFHDLFREAMLSRLSTAQPEMVPILHQRAAQWYAVRNQWREAITHRLAAADYSTAARLMEQKVEQFWVRGEAETIAHWVLALPQSLVREHAQLLLTTALYLLNTVTQTTREQRASVYQQVQRLMARVESSFPFQVDEFSHMTAAVCAGTGTAHPARDLDALLHRRLRLLHAEMAWYEALATWEYERLGALYQETQELDQDEEIIWQLIPLLCSFTFHHTIRQEGARLLPQLLAAKDRVGRSVSPFVSLKIRQYLVRVSLEAGQLRLAYRESKAALDLIEQVAGYVLLKGYFEITRIEVWYQWNRLEEARSQLHTVVQDATAWQHVNLLAEGYIELLRVALASGDPSLAEFALYEVEQLVQREHYGDYPGRLPALRAQWWLAQGQLREASDWAASVVFPEEAWDRGSYNAFPVVVCVYFAQHRFREALSLLQHWSGRLDRPTNVRITITYLAQSLVALHQTGKSEQARAVAARLFALTEPEGYLRVYLDVGEPMRQVLQNFLDAPQDEEHGVATIFRSYVLALLAAFAQEEHKRTLRVDGSHVGPREQEALPQPLSLQPGPALSRPVLIEPLTPQEQRVLRLLGQGLSNQEIAQTLIVSLNTVKTHVRNLYGKLQVNSRIQASTLARDLQLL